MCFPSPSRPLLSGFRVPSFPSLQRPLCFFCRISRQRRKAPLVETFPTHAQGSACPCPCPCPALTSAVAGLLGIPASEGVPRMFVHRRGSALKRHVSGSCIISSHLFSEALKPKPKRSAGCVPTLRLTQVQLLNHERDPRSPRIFILQEQETDRDYGRFIVSLRDSRTLTETLLVGGGDQDNGTTHNGLNSHC